jgi:hypothetical protein
LGRELRVPVAAPGVGAQGALLGGGERARGAGRETGEAEGTDAEPDQAEHGVPEARESASQLSATAFVQHDAKACALRSRPAGDVDPRGGGGATAGLEGKPGGEAPQRVGGGATAHGDEILLLAAERRVLQSLGERPVVGEEHEAFGVAVETADREETSPSRLAGEEVEHGGAALGVPPRRDDARRLVEQPVGPGLAQDLPAVELDAVALGIGGFAEAGDAPVHAHAPCAKQILGAAP